MHRAMALEADAATDFAGKVRLPLPEKFKGDSALWEEWSWSFKNYLSMFDPSVARALERAEGSQAFTDDDLSVYLDTGDLNAQATEQRVTFSRKLHYLLANLTEESARLIVRQNFESNGFETWRRLHAKFALPDATRQVALLTQLLDFRFNPSTFEQDFTTWESIKVKYEQQTGGPLPDGVLVATLLNKTTGALQQHLRLNAKTLSTYEQTKAVIIEYYRSKLILGANASAGSSANTPGPAPMDIGGLKGKNKGKGKGVSYFGGKGKGKGIGKKGRAKACRAPTESSDRLGSLMGSLSRVTLVTLVKTEKERKGRAHRQALCMPKQPRIQGTMH